MRDRSSKLGQLEKRQNGLPAIQPLNKAPASTPLFINTVEEESSHVQSVLAQEIEGASAPGSAAFGRS
jgi:hypothetical protein